MYDIIFIYLNNNFSKLNIKELVYAYLIELKYLHT